MSAARSHQSRVRPGILRRAASFLLPLLVLGAASATSPRSAQDQAKPGGTLRVRGFAETARPNLDPASGSWIFVTEQIFDGLVRLDADLRVWPSLAQNWDIEDAIHYVFYLRPGVRFHDGREMTAEDVKFSFERLLRPGTASPFAEHFLDRVAGAREFREGRAEDVSGYKVIDRYIFEIRWLRPNVSALTLLGMSCCKILPRELVLGQEAGFFYGPVGTGPFKFSSWLRTPRLEIIGVRMERNAGYFGRKPFLDGIDYSPAFTEEHFLAREIDVIPYFADRLAARGGKVLGGGFTGMTYLAVSGRIPPFDRPAVRRALALGIDKEALAACWPRGETARTAAWNYIPAVLPGIVPRDAVDPYDPDKARQILEEQGFSAERPFPALTLYLPGPRTAANLAFARTLLDQLRKLGLSASVSYFRSPGELKDVDRPFLAKIDWRPDYPDPEAFAAPLFHAGAELNAAVFGYSNPALDALLEKASAERSQARRLEIFRQVETLLGDDRPAVPLFYEEQRIAVQPYVRGLQVSGLGFGFLDACGIWLDKRD